MMLFIKYKSSGFTLLEIIIVCIVIAIVSIVSIPQYIKYTEVKRAQNAVANLQSILEAEKSYELDHGYYFTSGSINQINQNLGLQIEEVYFTYSITNGENSFTAEAKRDKKSWTLSLSLAADGETEIAASGWPWELPLNEITD